MTSSIPTFRPLRRATRATFLLASVLAATGCKGGEHNGQPTVAPATDSAPIHVVSAVAQARQLPQTLALTGTLVPDQQSQVTPLVGGRVTEVMVERGAQVQAGQPLIRLRDVDYRTAAASASAQVSQARARLGSSVDAHFDANQTAEVRSALSNAALADDSLRRTQQLAQTGAAAPQDLERAQQAAAAAHEALASAQNNARASYFAYQTARVAAEQSSRNVNDSVVRAPFAGEISERTANVGEYVTTQRAIVTLVKTDPLRIELQIPQEDIPYVHQGQRVDLHVDAFPDDNFTGTVQYISAAVRTDTRSLIAEAVVPNAQHRLRPGIFVTARLHLDRNQNAVAIPAAAVLTEAGTSRAYVAGPDGRAQERVVTIADRTADTVFVSHGIEANERVVTSNLDHLGDGVRVIAQ